MSMCSVTFAALEKYEEFKQISNERINTISSPMFKRITEMFLGK